MVGGLMFYSGKEKLFDDDGHPPAVRRGAVQGNVHRHVPGNPAAWIILGVLEFGVFVLLLASLVPPRVPAPPEQVRYSRSASRLRCSLFACLAFGQTATKQYAGTASLYTYFGATVVILILVSMLPPNRLRPLARRDPVALP